MWRSAVTRSNGHGAPRTDGDDVCSGNPPSPPSSLNALYAQQMIQQDVYLRGRAEVMAPAAVPWAGWF